MSTLDGGMVSAGLPALADAFDTQISTVLWVTVAFWVTNVGLLLTMGWLGDVAGRRRTFAAGYLVFALGLALSASSVEVWHLLVARIVQGVGSAMMLANVNALITTTFPTGQRGKALGVSGAIVGLGLSGGPFIGGALLEALDWRALFYSRIPLGLIGAATAWWFLAPDRDVGGRFRVDLLGASTLFVALGSALLVINRGAELGFTSTPVLALGAVAIVSTPVLIWTQRRSLRPIVDVTLFRSRQYTFALLVLTSHYLAHGPVILVAPFFLVDELAFSPLKMGLFLAAFYIGRTFFAPAAGSLSDRFGPRPFLMAGNAVLAASLVWMGLLVGSGSEALLLVAMVSAGVGSGLYEPVVTSAIMGSVPVARLGTASASVAMGRHIAFSVGVATAGAVFAIRERVYAADAATAGEVGRAFSDTLYAASVMATLAVVFAMATRRTAGVPA